jgi:hypothetical protein
MIPNRRVSGRRTAAVRRTFVSAVVQRIAVCRAAHVTPKTTRPADAISLRPVTYVSNRVRRKTAYATMPTGQYQRGRAGAWDSSRALRRVLEAAPPASDPSAGATLPP